MPPPTIRISVSIVTRASSGAPSVTLEPVRSRSVRPGQYLTAGGVDRAEELL